MSVQQAAKRINYPFFLLIAAAVLVVIALILAPIVDGQDDRWKAGNVLLTGMPFILCFVAVVLSFIFLIVAVALNFNGKINARLHRRVELIIIGGILLGVVGMFQSWAIEGYQIGFHLLLVCFIAFNIWGHITPKSERASQQH
jgi:hypothetical protein